jgi:hypothetical protein
VPALDYIQVDIVRQPERIEFAFINVMLVSSLYFRTHTNVSLQEEVHEQHNDDDIALESHTPSPSLSTSSTVLRRRKKPDTSDLCTTLTKFIASRNKSDRESSTTKKQLTVYFEDIAKTMASFPEADLAETKREIFNLVNKKEIELLMQKQS